MSEQCSCGAGIRLVNMGEHDTLIETLREWRASHVHEANTKEEEPAPAVRAMGFVQPKDEEEFVVHRQPGGVDAGRRLG